MSQHERNINELALKAVGRICCSWFGKDMEAITVAIPLADYAVSVLRLDLKTGRWRIFGSKRQGVGILSLAAFLSGIDETEAACRLDKLFGDATC